MSSRQEDRLPPSESKRVFGLDLMRSVAILLVLLSHTLMLFRFQYPMTGWGALSGILGVELFFVLSGFLIGGILLRSFEKSCRGYDLLHFWRQRWFRTLPNYYLFLIINLGVAYLTGDPSGNLRNIGGSVVFRIDACMFGVIGAWVKHYYANLWKSVSISIICLFAGIAVLIGTALMFRYLSQETSVQLKTNFYSLVPLGALLMLPALDAWKKTGNIGSTAITQVSMWSYSMYLVNFPIFIMTLYYGTEHLRNDALAPFICATICLLATFLIAALNYRFFEHPIMQLRNRFSNSPKQVDLPAP